MCGRFTLHTSGAAVARQFELAEVPELAPRYNIAPTQDVPVVRAAEPGRALHMLRWGLIPSWAKDASIGVKMINARAETLAEKPAFRTALARRRCLVLADGFYEWQGSAGKKQPFYFHMDDSQPFAFAGLWERWRGPNDAVVESCTIITTEANELLRTVHDRMPVILPPESYALWLDPAMHDAGPLLNLLQPFPAEEMASQPVSPLVNRVTNDGPECIAPLQMRSV
ncbi:MAG: SOS response-associated peptidase [Chloroflexaceae bacterium]|jgi:putative SOS response-associated peptidase YedK|nr:SOS response-associated peptidase [Chloroflexaceae bacterium]